MAQLSTLRGYVRNEIGEQTAGIWSDAQLNSWLNRGVDYCINEFYRGKCWQLLRKITKNATKTLSVSVTEYTMWDVITNVTANDANENSWYGYVHAMLGDYVLHSATLKEFHRLNVTTGEYQPSTTTPYIVFTGYDRATKYLAYTAGNEEPVKDGLLIGATSAAEARIAFCPQPTSGTFAGDDAAGNIYIYSDTGTFQSEALSYQEPNSSTTSATFTMTIAAAATAESHDNCPIFSIYPSLSTADDLTVWWLNKPTAMSAATDYPDVPYDCDELLVLYAAARAWKANRNFDMHAAMWAEFMQELQKKVANYQELTFKSL